MEEPDFFAVYTSAFLQAPKEYLRRLTILFGERAEIKKLLKPDAVSIGGRGKDEQPLSFLDWITELRTEGIKSWEWQYVQQDELFYLQVITKKATRRYLPNYINNPYAEMTGAKLASLIDAQAEPVSLWKRLVDKTNEFNKRNKLPLTDAKKLKAWFSEETPLRNHVNVRMDKDQELSDALWEIQLECAVKGLPFKIPAGFKNLLHKIKENRVTAGDTPEDQLSNEGWTFVPSKKNWQAYFFESAGKGKVETDLARAGAEFSKGLEKAAVLAKSLRSPFAPTFSLAGHILKERLPAGDFEKAHWKTIKQTLDQQGFTKSAIDKLTYSFAFSEEARDLGWSLERFCDLFVYEVTDVFDNDGPSWNKTPQLYQARNVFRAAIWSGSPGAF